MRLLLDTHVWLWMLARPERLSSKSRETLSNPKNELFLSAASAWEIAIKSGLGRLDLPAPAEEYVPDRLQRSGVLGLAIELTHTLRTASLPPHHRDPFDRLLIAQAQVEDLCLATADSQLASYEVEILDIGEP